MQKYLAFGLDDERPYGPVAETPEGEAFLTRKMIALERMNNRFDAADIGRTHFILSSYLERAHQKIGRAILSGVYPADNPLLDIQQHTHSHGVMEKLHGVAKEPMSIDEYVMDIKHANGLIQNILDVRPTGLRTPYGYEHDLSQKPGLLAGLADAGIRFVSSDMGPKTTLEGPVTAERQPHSYAEQGYPHIMEMPGHGLQDVVFTREKAKQLFNRDTIASPAEITAHFEGLLETAEALPLEKVAVNLILHPWAVMEYDPKGEILIGIAQKARDRGFEVLSYRAVADAFRE